MKPSKIFLDTNVLLYQTFEDIDAEKHALVNATLRALFDQQHQLYISTQIVREFIALATNDAILNTPLRNDDVLLKISEFETNFVVLFETPQSLQILKTLFQRYEIKKYRVHDANIAATVLANGLDFLWTFNLKDFKPFTEIRLFEIESLEIE